MIMKRKLAALSSLLPLVVAIGVFVSGCNTAAGQAGCQILVSAAEVAASTINANVGANVQTLLTGACVPDAAPTGPAPGTEGTTGETDQCAPVENEDACQTCLRSMCCDEMARCGGDYVCWCNVACDSQQATGHGSAAACAATYGCGVADAVFTSATTCAAQNCASECDGLLAAVQQ
jgi:hypothetical protein